MTSLPGVALIVVFVVISSLYQHSTSERTCRDIYYAGAILLLDYVIKERNGGGQPTELRFIAAVDRLAGAEQLGSSVSYHVTRTGTSSLVGRM